MSEINHSKDPDKRGLRAIAAGAAIATAGMLVGLSGDELVRSITAPPSVDERFEDEFGGCLDGSRYDTTAGGRPGEARWVATEASDGARTFTVQPFINTPGSDIPNKTDNRYGGPGDVGLGYATIDFYYYPNRPDDQAFVPIDESDKNILGHYGC